MVKPGGSRAVAAIAEASGSSVASAAVTVDDGYFPVAAFAAAAAESRLLVESNDAEPAMTAEHRLRGDAGASAFGRSRVAVVGLLASLLHLQQNVRCWNVVAVVD